MQCNGSEAVEFDSTWRRSVDQVWESVWAVLTYPPIVLNFSDFRTRSIFLTGNYPIEKRIVFVPYNKGRMNLQAISSLLLRKFLGHPLIQPFLLVYRTLVL